MSGITLSQFIKELQCLEREPGDEVVLSIGACSGTFGGMVSPFVVNLAKKRTNPKDPWNVRAYVPFWSDDIGKTYTE